MKPYVKPTDRNNYLHFYSFHKHQLKTNIPYGQFLRVMKNSTRDSDYRTHAKRLKEQFLKRGYPMGIINAAELRARQRARESLFSPRQNDNQHRLFLALDYTPKAAMISTIVRKHWHLLNDIPGCKDPPLIGLRKTRSLRSMLVKSETKTDGKTSSLPRGHFHCGKCKFCPFMVTTKKISFPDVNLNFKPSCFSNCNTSFVTYLVECPCSLRYVGSTQHPLRVRIQEHVSRIWNNTQEAPLSNNHSCDDLKVYVLEVIKAQPFRNRKQMLLQREVFWITRLQTLHPEGLNSNIDFGVFLWKPRKLKRLFL